MMHMSGSLGVNCTYATKQPGLDSWESVDPAAHNRSGYGIQMVPGDQTCS